MNEIIENSHVDCRPRHRGFGKWPATLAKCLGGRRDHTGVPRRAGGRRVALPIVSQARHLCRQRNASAAELAVARRCKLVVLDLEDGGRFSREAFHTDHHAKSRLPALELRRVLALRKKYGVRTTTCSQPSTNPCKQASTLVHTQTVLLFNSLLRAGSTQHDTASGDAPTVHRPL